MINFLTITMFPSIFVFPWYTVVTEPTNSFWVVNARSCNPSETRAELNNCSIARNHCIKIKSGKSLCCTLANFPLPCLWYDVGILHYYHVVRSSVGAIAKTASLQSTITIDLNKYFQSTLNMAKLLKGPKVLTLMEQGEEKMCPHCF